MQLSLSNWIFSKLPLEESIGKISKLGFSNMEFNPKCIEYESYESIYQVKKLVELHKLKCLSVHCATTYIEKTSQIQEAIHYGKTSINLASVLLSPVLVVHSYVSKGADTGTRRELLKKIFGELIDYSLEKKVKRALENIRPTSRGFGSTINEFDEILDTASREDFFVTLDFSHAQAAGQTSIFLEKFRTKIINVHLSSQSHKALQPTSELEMLLETLKRDGYSGPLTIEINPFYGEEEAKKSKIVLERMLNSLGSF